MLRLCEDKFLIADRGDEMRTPMTWAVGILVTALLASQGTAAEQPRRMLYVAEPGIRNYLEYGGHGVLVFDIDQGHKFLRRIPTAGLNEKGVPDNVKGICASTQTDRLYISTIRTLQCLDLKTEKVLWERSYPGGCDRMAISPDGKVIYLPSLEKEHWHVVDGATGDVVAKITPNSKAHNTVFGPDGRECYLAGLGSPFLSIADTITHTVTRQAGPFSAEIRPFTVNGSQTLCFVNVNKLLGFEVGDLVTGKMLHRVEVAGNSQGPVKRHGCPSHGIGMTPDEKEIWVCDATNRRMHLFDATQMPPKQVASIPLRDEPGWITFSIDGTLAWPSTGEVIDVKTRQIIATLTDEEGRAVQSEKLLELDFQGEDVSAAGCQFGVGAVGVGTRK